MLLGLQLTLGQVLAVGGAGLGGGRGEPRGDLRLTLWLGRRLGVDRKLAELIAAGTSICGASAVIAANTVTEGSDEDVAYAVACVTVFGSLAMLLYPALPGLLHLDPRAFGLWAGASIHEIAQVVAAAFQDGKEAGEFATIAKLSRVMLLAPVVMCSGSPPARPADAAANSRERKARAHALVRDRLHRRDRFQQPRSPAACAEGVARAGDHLPAVGRARRDGARDRHAQAARPRALRRCCWAPAPGFSLAASACF